MPFVSKLSKERFIHLYEEECLAVLEYEDITIKLTPYFNFKPDGSSHPFRFTTARYECFLLACRAGRNHAGALQFFSLVGIVPGESKSLLLSRSRPSPIIVCGSLTTKSDEKHKLCCGSK